MRRSIRRSFARLLPVLVLSVGAQAADAEGIRWDRMAIPVASGLERTTIELDAIVIRPDDRAAHPLAILNHGSPRNGDARASMTPFALWRQTSWFAQRGWTAVAVMRRGYGLSGGDWAESYGSCGDPHYVEAGRAGGDDIAAVAAFMEQQPYVAKGLWISVGVSAGAFATLALAARAPAGLAAAIALAPGRGSRKQNEICGESRLVAAFATFGRTSRTPLLWVNAQNDHFFGPAFVTSAVDAFSGAGGTVDHVTVPSFGTDGHFLFSAAGASLWEPIVDRFLGVHHLKLRTQPIEVIPPKVTPPAGLGDGGRTAFTTYLAAGPNKAFALDPQGHFGWATGRGTAEQSRRDALSRCEGSVTGRRCAIVNVNDAAVHVE